MLRVKIGDFLSCVILKFDGWPWTIIGHPFYATLSFEHHFIAISHFNLLQSGNAQCGSKPVSSGSCMTFKNHKAPLLCYFKLFASFHNHRWIQTWVIVRKPSIWVKISYFLSRVTLKFDEWSRKTIGHIFFATSSFLHNFVAVCKFKRELQSGNPQIGEKMFWPLWPPPLTSDHDLLYGNNFIQWW